MTLSEVRRAMGRYAQRFDPALVSAREASRIVEDAAAIENMAATVKSLAAARAAETPVWKHGGDRSAAHALPARRARRLGRPRRPSRPGALHQAVCGADRRKKQSSPGATKILVRIDFDALLRGAPIGDEVCELAGYGPVAVSAVRDLLDTRDPFLAAIITKGKDVVGVAHLGRRPTSHQRSALEWLYPTCAAEGCNSLTFLEFDHREDWSKTHLTVFDLLDRLCSHHHRLKTTDGWRFVEGRASGRSSRPTTRATPDIPGGTTPPDPQSRYAAGGSGGGQATPAIRMT